MDGGGLRLRAIRRKYPELFSPMTVVDPSYRFLACQYLREQLDVLMRQLHGVRRDDDIEPVHQARVASRRVRAALGMFTDCFDTKKAAKWPKQVRKLTRELGAARDKDVQIEFVAQFLATLEEHDKKNRPGVERLLLRLRQGREALQSEVVATLDKLEKTDTLAEMYGEMEKILFTLRSHDTRLSSPFVLRATRAHICDRRDDLVACARSLDDPEDIRGHHKMRIAAKKLRYTLEISDPVYEGRLADSITACKQVQSLLGDIHDCDVWVQDIDAFVERERLATMEYFGHSQPFNRLKPGLLLVREERAKRRRQVFGELLEYWKSLDAERFWDALEGVLEQQDTRSDVEKEQDEENRPAQ
jgi:CHAD domain-containing protein